MWGIRFPDIETKRRRRRTPPKKQSGASAAEGGASAAPTSLDMTEIYTTQSAPPESDDVATTATHAPHSLERWLANGRRDGADLAHVEEAWRDFHAARNEKP